MTTGFVTRFKGKIKASTIFLDSSLGKGLQLNGPSGFVQAPNVWSNAGAPASGASGTLFNFANPGDLLVDTTNLQFYQNTGTLASPTWTPFLTGISTLVSKAVFLAPLPADTTSSTPVLVAPVTPSNVALTIAFQPPQARKLYIQVVIGTTNTTAITAGNLALVGVDQDGNAVSENISLIKTATAIIKSAHAYAKITTATVSAYAANGSGTGNTIGIGQSNDFGLPTAVGVSNLAIVKCSKIITTVTGGVTAWSRAVTDDGIAGTLDTTARTYAPTTAPGVAGINDYEITYSYSA